MIRRILVAAALGGLALVACAGAIRPIPAAEPSDGHAIMVHLQDGYDAEIVTVWADSERIYRGAVRTNHTIGLAKRLEATTADEAFTLRVAIPALGIDETYTLDVNDGAWVGVSVVDGSLFLVQAEFFGYM